MSKFFKRFWNISVHLRLGHNSLDRINRLTKDGPLKYLSVGTLPICESYLEGKMTKRPFTTKGLRAEQPLELVYSDVCGPFSIQVDEVMSITSYLLMITQDLGIFT